MQNDAEEVLEALVSWYDARWSRVVLNGHEFVRMMSGCRPTNSCCGQTAAPPSPAMKSRRRRQMLICPLLCRPTMQNSTPQARGPHLQDAGRVGLWELTILDTLANLGFFSSTGARCQPIGLSS